MSHRVSVVVTRSRGGPRRNDRDPQPDAMLAPVTAVAPPRVDEPPLIAPTGPLVDLNNSSEQEIASLPGIGQIASPRGP